MSPRHLLLRLLRRWHARIGFAAMLFFLILAVTVLAPGVGAERALVGARGAFHLRTAGLRRSACTRDFGRAAASRSAQRKVRGALWAAGRGFAGSAARGPLSQRGVALPGAPDAPGKALKHWRSCDRRRFPVLLFSALAALACVRATAAEHRASSYVFGTLVEITVVDADATLARKAVGQVVLEFDRMHRELHAWKVGDLVALNQAIASGKENIRTTKEIAALIGETQRLAARSEGLFNPAIGSVVGLLSFHRDKPGGPLPDPEEIARIVRAD